MVKQYKIDEVSALTQKLNEQGNIILTHYSGIKVKDLGELRRKLRAKGGDYKIVKNNLFKRAMKDASSAQIDEHLKGPIGVVFTKNDLSDVAKVLKEFAKEQEKFSFTVAVMDRIVYYEDQIKRIADLPSKDVVLSQMLSLFNGPSTKIAIGLNQIMASLARGIKAVAEKNAQ